MSRPNVAESIARIKTLPTLPAVLSRILATTADPDSSALDLSRHVAADQILTATLLKLVNSAYYGHYRQVDSVTTAIVMLGFHEVRNLTLAMTAFRSFPQGDPDFDRTQLWRHCLAAAMAAESLSRIARVPVGGCFVSGLLHDIGKVILDVVHPKLFRIAAHNAHDEGRLILDTEVEILGLSHPEAGGILAERWELPPSVVDAVRYHHEPKLSAPVSPFERAQGGCSLAGLVALADYATYQAGLGESSNGCNPVLPAAALTFGLEEKECAGVVEHLRQSGDRIDEFIGALH